VTSAIPASATPYIIIYSNGGDTNFSTATNSGTTLMVGKATATFRSVTASQSITVGTASISLGGTLSSGCDEERSYSLRVATTFEPSTFTSMAIGGRVAAPAITTPRTKPLGADAYSARSKTERLQGFTTMGWPAFT
jgi:hypothetical protein